MTPKKSIKVARDGIKEQDHLALLKPMAYQNTYAVAVPKKIAQEYGLKTISDFKKFKDNLKQVSRWNLTTVRTETKGFNQFMD